MWLRKFDNILAWKFTKQLISGRGLPNVQPILKHFKNAFDWVDANNSGRIIPRDGVDKEYDAACRAVQEIESILKEHLKAQRKVLGDASVRIVKLVDSKI